jgi:(2R)-sulfolactate sulfo-lyase subunit beta
MNALNNSFMGYVRENGRVGVRNHVAILPVDDISNAACEAVANNIKGTMALPHAYGRLQFGEDLELHFRTMIGTGSNPNIAACVVIGIEPGWTSRIVDGIAKTGKPVVGFSIEQNGDINTIAAASRAAKEFVHMTSEYQREECDVSTLWVSTKCGESDTTTGLSSCPTVGNMYDKLLPKGIYGVFGETSEITGAEHLCEARAANPEAAKKFMHIWQAYTDDVIEQFKTSDLSESQPTKGNIEGGLTTIEEKGPWQSGKDWPHQHLYRCARSGRRTSQRGRAVFYGYLLGGGRMYYADGGGGVCCAYVPDRSGQCGGQPDCTGDQDYR